MIVEDVMTTDITTVERDVSLYEAVETMLEKNVEQIVVCEDGTPTTLITQQKVLVASYKTDESLKSIPVANFGQGFTTTIEPTSSILTAITRLQQTEAAVLPVLDGLDFVGVITASDIMDNISDIADELPNSYQQKSKWLRD